MSSPVLTDQFGRQITYLRMSVTDRCSFRCTYCMPAEGLRTLGVYDLLTLEELERIGRLFVEAGIRKIRLTGGEPLLRPDLPELIGRLSRLQDLDDLCMTTNGLTLDKHASELAEAGLHRINVSVDSLNAERFRDITRGGDLFRVLEGIRLADRFLPGPTKINVVVNSHSEMDEILDFVRLTVQPGYIIRFIEQMPLSPLAAWNRTEVLSVHDIRARIREEFGLEPVESGNGHAGPASRFRIPDARGELGFIGAVTDEFCARCNRIRLTPDGQLRGCLMSEGQLDLRSLMREGGSDIDIRAMLDRLMQIKPERHTINDTTFDRPVRTMSQIGG